MLKRILQSVAGLAGSWLSTIIIIGVCIFLIVYVFIMGIESISWDFLTKEPNPSALHAKSGGILTPLVGTFLLTVIGIVLAYPLGLATAITLVFYTDKGIIRSTISTTTDILSGIPTIVVALFSMAVFTKSWFSFLSVPIETAAGVERAYGKSFLVAGITMAIMVLPFVTKTIEEALKAVPHTYYEASMALGATKWRTISKVIMGTATPGLITSVLLGMGRIIGDTAIVWLVLGGTLRMTGLQPWWVNWKSTLQNTGSTLTSYIFYTSPAGEGNSPGVSFGASLVLIVIILLLNLIASSIFRLYNLKAGGKIYE